MLNNIVGYGNIAIINIVNSGEEVANVFDDGFDIVVNGLTQFGEDLSTGFL